MNGKLVWITATLAAAVVLVGCSRGGGTTTEPAADVGGVPVQQAPNGYTLYEDTTHGFSISYPDDWDEAAGEAGAVVAFLSPQEGDADLFRQNVNVVVQDLAGQAITLDEFTDVSVEQIEALFTNVEVLDSQPTTLAGAPAHRIVYSGEQGQLGLKWMQVWAIVDDAAYVVTYTADAKGFGEYERPAERMIGSFAV